MPNTTCVVNCVADSEMAWKEYALTSPGHKAYADKVGADYRLVTMPAKPDNVVATNWKYGILDVVEQYDTTLYLDNDCVITPTCPSFVKAVPDGHWGVVDEYRLLTSSSQRYVHSLVPANTPPLLWQANAGVMIMPKNARAHYFLDKSAPDTWIADQLGLSICLQNTPAKYRLLDRRWNWGYMALRDFYVNMQSAWIVHFNGQAFFEDKDARLRAITNCVDRMGIQAGSTAPTSVDATWWPNIVVQQPVTSELLAVTSVSPRRASRQTVCLDSWKKLGLEIWSVNSPKEIAALSGSYPQVSRWVVAKDDGFKTPRLNRLLDVSLLVNKPILIVNADIEAYGPQQRLLDVVARRVNLVGIRHNYEARPGDDAMEPWGLDAFIVYPEQVSRLTTVPFRIGSPVWDYWLPWELAKLGYTLEWLGEPFFYHRSHKLAWSVEECKAQHATFHSLFGEVNWGAWRQSQPFWVEHVDN